MLYIKIQKQRICCTLKYKRKQTKTAKLNKEKTGPPPPRPPPTKNKTKKQQQPRTNKINPPLKPNPPKIGRLAGLAGLWVGDAAEEGTVEAEGKLQALAADGDAAVYGPRQVVTMVE